MLGGRIVVGSGAKWRKPSMFIGEYRHNLDAKNRLIIPAKFREQLSTTVYVTEWMEGCLAAFPEQQWNQMIEQYSSLPMTDASARIFLRQINGKAEECSIDGQGRILLPQFLVSDTGIKKACVILGTAKHFEIWSEEKYDAYCSEVNLEESAAKVTEILK